MNANQIHGYDYATSKIEPSPVTLEEFEQLKITAGWTADDETALRLAGKVLSDQTKAIVDHWRRRIIAGIPNLARHSKSPEGEALPEYAANSGARFEQWILDTCLRPYDQDWLNYQHEIALRHMQPKKNQTDGVRSTDYVPFRHIIAFIPVMNETIKPYLAARGHGPTEVERMHCAWTKSLQLQLALWARPYSAPCSAESQW